MRRGELASLSVFLNEKCRNKNKFRETAYTFRVVPFNISMASPKEMTAALGTREECVRVSGCS